MHVNVVMLTEFLVRLRDERKLVASMFMSYRSAVANIPPGEAVVVAPLEEA